MSTLIKAILNVVFNKTEDKLASVDQIGGYEWMLTLIFDEIYAER